jgi:hypothetical protein
MQAQIGQVHYLSELTTQNDLRKIRKNSITLPEIDLATKGRDIIGC